MFARRLAHVLAHLHDASHASTSAVSSIAISANYASASVTSQRLHAVTKRASSTTATTDASTAEYDFVVIGGGSGGLAASKEAAKLGAKVALLDYVVPSPLGSKWGLGGTCVNVGCIPKKLFHQAAILNENVHDAAHYGWSLSNDAKVTPRLDWNKLVNNVQEHIKSLNWGYRTSLRENKVTYINALGSFVDQNTIQAVNNKGKTQLIKGNKFLIAVGGRPKYADFPGAKELCITSDDLFTLSKPPGKTLIVGASYIALESAGFLTGLGFDTTVMARSVFLRGFDQEIAQKIVSFMGDHGTKFLKEFVPVSVQKQEDGRLLVSYHNPSVNGGKDIKTEVYDTVLLAVGRASETGRLGLDKVSVKTDGSGKIVVDSKEATSNPSIFAIGDVAQGRPELTPTAIMAGKLLAHRLYGKSSTLMDYNSVPTTVFTPLEYGSIGISEEAAIAKFGAANVEVYHSSFKPLEWSLPHRPDNACFAKVICNKADNERVVGLHFLGPNAGEVTQGFSTGIKLGMTKSTLDTTVGIHPTSAEELTQLSISKSSGKSASKAGC